MKKDLWSEVERIENIHLDPVFGTFSYTARCRVCGKYLELFYNGGELDRAACCGFSYELESPQTDFVVYRETPRTA